MQVIRSLLPALQMKISALALEGLTWGVQWSVTLVAQNTEIRTENNTLWENFLVVILNHKALGSSSKVWDESLCLWAQVWWGTVSLSSESSHPQHMGALFPWLHSDSPSEVIPNPQALIFFSCGFNCLKNTHTWVVWVSLYIPDDLCLAGNRYSVQIQHMHWFTIQSQHHTNRFSMFNIIWWTLTQNGFTTPITM